MAIKNVWDLKAVTCPHTLKLIKGATAKIWYKHPYIFYCVLVAVIQFIMTLENSLKAEIGDTLIADYNNGIWDKDDICILIEKSPEYEKCTEGQFFNKTKNIKHGGNVQSFHYCN